MYVFLQDQKNDQRISLDGERFMTDDKKRMPALVYALSLRPAHGRTQWRVDD